MDIIDPVTRMVFFKTYNFLSQTARPIWDFFYSKTNRPIGRKAFDLWTAPNYYYNQKQVSAVIEKFNPDYILCTHYTPHSMLKHCVKSQCLKNYHSGVVITDFALHKLWVNNPQADYFVDNQEIKIELTKNKIAENRITISNIPLRPDFYTPKNSCDLYAQLNINPHAKTILIMSGGLGTTGLKKVVTQLTDCDFHQPINIIAITGKNQKLLQQLQTIKTSSQINFYPVGWTEKIDEYMRLADIIVTKPGGLSLSESLHFGKPIVVINPLPGQEEDNCRYLTKHNYGLAITDQSELPGVIKKILDKKISFNTRPPNHAAATIVKKILKNLPR